MNNAEIDSAFFAITENLELDITGIKEYAPVDHIIEEILGFYAAYLEKLSHIDIDDEDEAAAVRKQLEASIRLDFVELIDNLKFGDDIIASGDVVVLKVDNETDTYEDVEILSDDVRLYGKINNIFVTEVPDAHEIDRVLDLSSAPESEEKPLIMDKFGLTLEIVNASVGAIDGEREQIPDIYTVLLPLDSLNLKLKRQI